MDEHIARPNLATIERAANVQQTHLAHVAAILQVLSDTDPAHASIACEDAYVALTMGMVFGLSMSAIIEQACGAITDVLTPRES